MIYSTDGINWSRGILPSAQNWISIAWNGSTFCIISNNGYVANSTDGIRWTIQNSLSGNWIYIRAHNSMFIAGTNAARYIATSMDGLSWSVKQIPVSNGTYDMASNGSTICLLNAQANGNILVSTDNGNNWKQVFHPGFSYVYSAIAWNGSMFCVVGNSGNYMTSPDGFTWTYRVLNFPTSSTIGSNCIGAAPNKFVLFGNENQVAVITPDTTKLDVPNTIDAGLAKQIIW
jgi:photosystem II stability/assembly factor-like uncharacterized protein